MLDSLPTTISLALGSLCSEALHRTMLISVLRHQSNMCFMTLLRIIESKIHQVL